MKNEIRLQNILINITISLAQHQIVSKNWTDSMLEDIKNAFKEIPPQKGEKVMYSVSGVGGGIYGFSLTKDQAVKVRDKCWNIGKSKPLKYVVSFRRVE